MCLPRIALQSFGRIKSRQTENLAQRQQSERNKWETRQRLQRKAWETSRSIWCLCNIKPRSVKEGFRVLSAFLSTSFCPFNASHVVGKSKHSVQSRDIILENRQATLSLDRRFHIAANQNSQARVSNSQNKNISEQMDPTNNLFDLTGSNRIVMPAEYR